MHIPAELTIQSTGILYRCLLTVPLLAFASTEVRGQSRQWFDLGIGVGGENTTAADSIFNASAQYEVRAGLNRVMSQRLVARVGGVVNRVLGPQADCLTSTRQRCEGATNQVGAVAQLLYPFGAGDPASAPFIGAGAGVYKITRSGGGVTPIVTPGLNVRLDLPLVSGDAGAWGFAADGTYLPRVAGGSSWLVIISTGVRIK